MMFLFQCFSAKKITNFEYTHSFWVFVILVVETSSMQNNSWWDRGKETKKCASVNVQHQYNFFGTVWLPFLFELTPIATSIINAQRVSNLHQSCTKQKQVCFYTLIKNFPPKFVKNLKILITHSFFRCILIKITVLSTHLWFLWLLLRTIQILCSLNCSLFGVKFTNFTIMRVNM